LGCTAKAQAFADRALISHATFAAPVLAQDPTADLRQEMAFIQPEAFDAFGQGTWSEQRLFVLSGKDRPVAAPFGRHAQNPAGEDVRDPGRDGGLLGMGT